MVPQHAWLQTIPHNALTTMRHVSRGGFVFEQISFRATSGPSGESSRVTRLASLDWPVMTARFPGSPPPSFEGIERPFPPPPPRDALEGGEVPSALLGRPAYASHSLPESKCQLQWHS